MKMVTCGAWAPGDSHGRACSLHGCPQSPLSPISGAHGGFLFTGEEELSIFHLLIQLWPISSEEVPWLFGFRPCHPCICLPVFFGLPRESALASQAVVQPTASRLELENHPADLKLAADAEGRQIQTRKEDSPADSHVNTKDMLTNSQPWSVCYKALFQQSTGNALLAFVLCGVWLEAEESLLPGSQRRKYVQKGVVHHTECY